MSFSSSEKHTGAKAFLRNQSEPRQSIPHATNVSPVAPEATPEGQIFPLPRIKAEIDAQLAPYDRFAVLAIAIHPPVVQGNTTNMPLSMQDCLETIQKDNDGFWFSWQPNLCGYVLSNHDAQSAKGIAQQIIDTLAQTTLDRVTIGLSQFPHLAYDRSDAMQNACKALNHAAFFGPSSIVIFDAISLNISGDLYYQSQDLGTAITEYNAALAIDPENTNVHNSLGVCLAQLENYETARKAFQKALSLDPEEAMAAYNLGVLDLLTHEQEKALEHFYQAYARETKTAEIPFQIGKLLTEQKEYKKAVEYLEATIALCPDWASAYTLLGRCQAAIDQTREAIHSYKKAVKKNPNDADALSALGELYDARGENPDICLTFCKQSVALSPENGLFRFRLAKLYHKYQNLDNALSEYEAANDVGYDTEKQIAQIQEKLATEDTDKNKQCCA